MGVVEALMDWIISIIQHTSINTGDNNAPCLAAGSETSGNWEAVDAQSPKSDSRFYLNVCHKVVQSGEAVSCPVNASICAVGKSQTEKEMLLTVAEVY